MLTFEEKLTKARKFVASLDTMDGCRDRNLKMIAAALECGLRNPDTGAQFDALVMLNDLIATPAKP